MIKLDKKDPVTMAYISIVVSFGIFVGILYLINPAWVQVVDKETGNVEISWELVISSSATFSFVIAIAVMIMVSNERIVEESLVN